MTDFVCAQLSAPDSNGLQNCANWVVNSGTFADQLNALSQQDAITLIQYTVACFAAAWAWNFLATFVNRH